MAFYSMPVTVGKKKFEEDLDNLIAHSELPYFIMDYVLIDKIREIRKNEKLQYEEDLTNWNRHLSVTSENE